MGRGQIVGRIVELSGWIGLGGVGFVMLTQAAGWTGMRLVAILQSLTPYGIPLVLGIAVVSVWRRREALAAAGAMVGVGAFILSIPLVIGPSQPPLSADAAEIRVASINLLFSNPVIGDVADDLVELDPDLIVFSEFTAEHSASLRAHPLADGYPYRIDRAGRFARGMAVWSRLPVDENVLAEPIGRTVGATVSGPDGPIRLIGVHPPTPVSDFTEWKRELGRIGDAASTPGDPTLVIGDFNASYWHPVFRDLLRRDLTDAHLAHGDGWSTSWPTDEFIPPFVRLDHALTGDGLVSTAVDDFDVPGSDHVGFVVTVSRTERLGG